MDIEKCPVCRGRGYHPCDCWPGDCICGYGDEDCDICGGSGALVPYEDYDLYEPAPAPKAKGGA